MTQLSLIARAIFSNAPFFNATVSKFADGGRDVAAPVVNTGHDALPDAVPTTAAVAVVVDSRVLA